MKKTIFTLFCIAIVSISYGQNSDTALFYKILNKQLKIVKSSFKNVHYSIDSRFMNFKEDSAYAAIDICPQIHKWDSNKSSDKSIIFKDSSSQADYSCSISKPYFNSKRNKCWLKMACHDGEWGGFGAIYYYKKILGWWIKGKSVIQWVS